MFADETWKTAKIAATTREKNSSDMYFQITQKLLACDQLESFHNYHPSCYKKYTAVKHSRETSSPDEEPTPKKAFISDSVLPESDCQGLLKGICIFCGKSRKNNNNKEETKLKVTTAGCLTLIQRAKFSSNERIKRFIESGEDLVVQKAEYHKSCRALFLKETEEPHTSSNTKSNYHKQAFALLLSYIQNEVLDKKKICLSQRFVGHIIQTRILSSWRRCDRCRDIYITKSHQEGKGTFERGHNYKASRPEEGKLHL